MLMLNSFDINLPAGLTWQKHIASMAPASQRNFLRFTVTDIKVDTTVGTLRNRSVGWVVNAIHDLNRPDLILKVCGQIFFVQR